ncbi:hypothetical protein E2C01_014508 [Portunus trituberculatus]|uniref:Uncharacterized protein n=1 Tax=Portunus trituberculatus TaxID=210409 RepID=A0A5B7DKD0_PORTR|nr:hypothetical protein [Portunus trituberculatus]
MSNQLSRGAVKGELEIEKSGEVFTRGGLKPTPATGASKYHNSRVPEACHHHALACRPCTRSRDATHRYSERYLTQKEEKYSLCAGHRVGVWRGAGKVNTAVAAGKGDQGAAMTLLSLL